MNTPLEVYLAEGRPRSRYRMVRIVQEVNGGEYETETVVVVSEAIVSVELIMFEGEES